MRDLRPDLDTLWRASSRLTSAKGARALMFMSVGEGEGTSSVAASFGLLAASRTHKPTWLVDLDLHNNPQMTAFEKGFAEDVGDPGHPYDGSLGQKPFFEIFGQNHAEVKPALRSGKLLAAYQIEGTRLLVTRFRNERLAYGQNVRLSAQPDWWTALRRSAGWIVVDTPSVATSGAGLGMASLMDGVVLVVRADRTTPKEVTNLKQEVEVVGGHVLGVVMNHMRADSLFADRLAG